jgi:predicted NUDIX family phosphoesterase
MTQERRVLVIPSPALERLGTFHGFVGGHLGRTVERIALGFGHPRWLAKAEAELDPTHKQIIPYLVVQFARAGWRFVLTYRRGPVGSERRLTGLSSLGVGGHVEPEDGPDIEGGSVRGVIERAARRELAEELGVARGKADAWPLEWVGLVNDESTSVGRVHLGLVGVVTVQHGEVLTGGDGELADATWTRTDLLHAVAWEPWSRFVAEGYLGAAARAG